MKCQWRANPRHLEIHRPAFHGIRAKVSPGDALAGDEASDRVPELVDDRPGNEQRLAETAHPPPATRHGPYEEIEGKSVNRR